jgi:hypothetical protein
MLIEDKEFLDKRKMLAEKSKMYNNNLKEKQAN